MLIVRSAVLAGSLTVLTSLVACAPIVTTNGVVATTGYVTTTQVLAAPAVTYAMPYVSTVAMAPQVPVYTSTPMMANYGSPTMVTTAPMINAAPAAVSVRQVVWP
jgi:hypothetical protein